LYYTKGKQCTRDQNLTNLFVYKADWYIDTKGNNFRSCFIKLNIIERLNPIKQKDYIIQM
jgi:hypothetical protein